MKNSYDLERRREPNSWCGMWTAQARFVFGPVGTSRCDIPARAVAGGTTCGEYAAVGATIAPLNAARTAQRTVPTSLNRHRASLLRYSARVKSSGQERSQTYG
jgi:hypothetical protein